MPDQYVQGDMLSAEPVGSSLPVRDIAIVRSQHGSSAVGETRWSPPPSPDPVEGQSNVTQPMKCIYPSTTCGISPPPWWRGPSLGLPGATRVSRRLLLLLPFLLPRVRLLLVL